MVNLIAQARTAAHDHHWSTVVTFLNDLLRQPPSSLDPTQLGDWLSLAMQVLQAGDFQERWDVAKVFPTFGAEAIAPLVELLQDEDADLEGRWFAARILGELNHPLAIQVLVEQVQNANDDDLSKVAAEALAQLGPPAIEALTDLLYQEDSRVFAIQALAQIHQPETISPLLRVVDDPDPNIRAMAIDALTSFRDAQIPLVLLKAAKDPAARVRQAAIAGLGLRIHQTNAVDLKTVLCEALWDINLSVSRQAVLSLGRLQHDATVPNLKRALDAPNTSVSLQVDIVRALGWIGTEIALSCLQELLWVSGKSYPIEVYQETVTTLGLWNDANLKPQATEILVTFLGVQSPPVQSASLRQAIAIALGQLKQTSALDALIQLLADSDPSVQLHTIAALKTLDSGVALARLQEARQEASSNALQAGIDLALREWQLEFPKSPQKNN